MRTGQLRHWGFAGRVAWPALSLLTLALVLGGCSTGSLNNDDYEQKAGPSILTATMNTVDVANENVGFFRGLSISGASYEDGWWRVTIDFDLSMGATGTLGLQAQWKDKKGNVVQFPLFGLSEMTVKFDLGAVIQGQQTAIGGNIVLLNLSGGFIPSDVEIDGTGNGYYGSSNFDLAVTDLVFGVTDYPTGRIDMTLVDPSFGGTWDVRVLFDGTKMVKVEADNASGSFELFLDLSCACLVGA